MWFSFSRPWGDNAVRDLAESFNPASAIRDVPVHVVLELPSPLLVTVSATPYFLRSSDPSTNFFARPSARPFPFLLDFDLGRLSFTDHIRAFCSSGDYSTVLFWATSTLFDLEETFITTVDLHIFSSGLFLLGPYSSLQIQFVMGAYCFPFPFSILLCVY